MKWPMMFRGLTGWAAAAVWIGAIGAAPDLVVEHT